MKHGWNSWDGYLAVHEKVLRFYAKFMATPKMYTVTKVTDRFYTLSCEDIQFTTYNSTRLRVDLRKDVLIEERHGRLMAKTFGYSYNANRPNPDGRNVIRYDSPHSDHNQYHHRHDYTVDPPVITKIGDDEYPHVGEFLNEVLVTF